MSEPITSLIKIGFVALLICFSSFVGFINTLFAAYPGDDPQCPPVILKEYGGVYYNLQDWLVTVSFDEATGTFSNSGYAESSPGYNVGFAVYYWDYNSWIRKYPTGSGWYTSQSPETFDVIYNVPTDADDCPSLPCGNKRELLAQDCGGEDKIEEWSDTTCSGFCEDDNVNNIGQPEPECN